jgi:hypothetical protein
MPDNNNQNCLKHILFSGEATFCLNRFVNKHNCRYWFSEIPHWMMEHHTQHPQKLNVWAGIIGHHMIGPYFIDGNLTADRFLNLLRDHIVPDIEIYFWMKIDRECRTAMFGFSKTALHHIMELLFACF